ncbi:MAG: diguanylate cyclase [Actinomycetales bacterium]|nr:diguanylate cyclase [Actinomycetales bacterium]
MPGNPLRRALAPEVDPHAASFLGRGFAGMAGPVWSMAAVNLALAAAVGLAAVTLAAGGTWQTLRLSMSAVWVLLSMVLVVAKDRVPGWYLHVNLDVTTVFLCLGAATAASPVRSAALLFFLLLPALYAATWFPRSQMAGHLLVLVVASGGAILSTPVDRDRAGLFVTLMLVTILSAYFVNALVSNLNHAAVIDPLTGLLNRAGLRLATETQGSHNMHVNIVAAIDLDGLKVLNDTEGHAAGDRILAETGAVLRAHLRPSDIVARVGGDEFVVVLRRTEPLQAEAVLHRIVEHLPLTASVGWVEWHPGSPLEESLQAADRLMYEQKERRRRG